MKSYPIRLIRKGVIVGFLLFGETADGTIQRLNAVGLEQPPFTGKVV